LLHDEPDVVNVPVLALKVILVCVALPAVLSSAYLLLATLLSARGRIPPRSTGNLRFDVIVPAHNEIDVIERTVASLRGLAWPKDKYRILVVADNCTDATAKVARAAGAHVLERHDKSQRGKGYALAYAFAASRAYGFAAAVVVVDADAEVSSNMLEAFACRIENGAHAVQVHYGVLNPHASWRTRLITIAKGSFHIVRSRARERLGLSCGIRGNGWCVTHGLLASIPYRAFSLTEDLEFGIEIGMAGHRVEYADEAHSNADMVAGEQQSRTQRQRWEAGRFQLIGAKTGALLRAAMQQPSLVCLDLALDLMVLPLSYVALNVTALVGLAALATWWHPQLAPWLWLGVACVASLAAYVLRGWQLSGVGWQGLLDLGRAPVFLLWKLMLMLSRRKSQTWVRTDRERQ
jgi:cellulose synthase/poly-beta-1,6-N-acetylglucosamine synthase-like glycosyltransferase